MTERDLENLKSLPVPSPRESAKRAAIDAALNAFQSALPAGSPLGESEAPMQNTSKGNVVPLRQTETSQPKRSFRMPFSSRQTQALAASVAAMMIVAPLAFQHVKSLRDAQPVAALKGEQTAVMPALSAPPRGDAVRARENQIETVGGSVTAESKYKEATPSFEPRAADARQEVDAKVTAAPPPAAAPAAASQETGKLSVGEQSLAADNAAIAGDSVRRIVPTDLVGKSQLGINGPERRLTTSTDGLGAVGGTSYPRPWEAKEDSKLAAAPPPASAPVAAIAAKLAREENGPSHAMGRAQDQPVANAELGRRIIDSDKYAAKPDLNQPHDPYAWMGHADEQRAVAIEQNRDKFNAQEINPVKQVSAEPVSTFSLDVDTASYAFVRRALNAGHLPPKDAVRVEEMINYFPYNYPAPDSTDTPFKPTLTVMPAPWNPNNQLVHVAIKGYDLKSTERPRANLVLLMDVSGSMQPEDRLPLVKNAFRLLIDQLKPDDTVGIVTYASGSGIVLTPTRVADKGRILAAIDQLGAGGSTAGAQGIQDAYRLAESGFDKSAVNRIILATDGDFNVGITDQNELKGYIERKRQSGIFLSILGVGQGNHNDALMQTLAQNGNGTAAYVDTLNEARKLLVDESSSTLFTIAKDVKVQIEWNPERVAEYRLIGYESRALKREDFNNDKIDAGDIGSGHTVTAIYEVTPVGAQVLSDDLRYGQKIAAKDNIRREPPATGTRDAELGFLKLRYKRPNEDVSNLVTLPIADPLPKTSLAQASSDVRFSIAVAAFAQTLRGTPYTAGTSYDDILALAQTARGEDPFGYRAEFMNLVRLAKAARP